MTSPAASCTFATMPAFKATALYDHGKAFEFALEAETIEEATDLAKKEAPHAITITVEKV